MSARVLVIAGKDSTGAAGLDADVKTIASLGMQPVPVATAQTTQDGGGVRKVEPIQAKDLTESCRAAFEAGPVAAIKTGMLVNKSLVDALVEFLETLPQKERAPLVIDPVLGATRGGRLIDGQGWRALRERLIPSATVLTPNLPEAADLAEVDLPVTAEQVLAVGKALAATVEGAVYLKGGHLEGPRSVDWLFSDGKALRFESPWIGGGPYRGTGCSLASALAVGLAAGKKIKEASVMAHDYIQEAIRSAVRDGDQCLLNHEKAARSLS